VTNGLHHAAIACALAIYVSSSSLAIQNSTRMPASAATRWKIASYEVVTAIDENRHEHTAVRMLDDGNLVIGTFDKTITRRAVGRASASEIERDVVKLNWSSEIIEVDTDVAGRTFTVTFGSELIGTVSMDNLSSQNAKLTAFLKEHGSFLELIADVERDLERYIR